MTTHSPLGGSSAERWISCPGSAFLANKMGVGGDGEESEYAREGTAAHELAAKCLKSGSDAWELTTNLEEAEAVQVYIDHCRDSMRGEDWHKIEEPVARPEDHEHLYGTVDFSSYGEEILEIVDYKHGAGIVVDPKDNPQLMYYAFGLLGGISLPERPIEVLLTIVQPRAFHTDGPIRTWVTSSHHIIEWAEKVLIPAMKRTEFDDNLVPGDHCRFCPLRLICPALQGMARAAVEADPKTIKAMTDEQLGAEYMNTAPVRAYLKAVEEETYRRLMEGTEVLGTKLVHQKAKRVWKDGAMTELVAALGDAAYDEPTLRSPAQLEKLGEEAKKLVAKFAYMPHTGYTVALLTDSKPSVKVTSSFANKGK